MSVLGAAAVLGTSIGEAEEVGVWGGPWGMAGAAVVGLGIGLVILTMSHGSEEHADAPPKATQDCPEGEAGNGGEAAAKPGEAPPPNRPPFPKDPQELLDNGWQETSHPEAAARGHRTFENPETGDIIRLDKGEAGANGFRGQDHYHWFDRGDPSGESYLDESGNTVRRGSRASHIPPR